MRNTLLIGGLCVLAIAIGAGLYFYTGMQRASVPSPTLGASASTEQSQEKEISFKVLDQGTSAKGVQARKNYAIYDAGEFTTFWNKAHGTDNKPVPVVDFSKNYVIAVFAGTEPTGGYSISVSRILEAGSARSISVLIQKPDDSCTVIEEQTSPYQFISVPISGAQSLAHTDVTVKKPCGPIVQ